MAKSVRIEAKVGGKIAATFEILDGVAQLISGAACDGVHDTAARVFGQEERDRWTDRRVKLFALITRDGSKWATAVRVDYMGGGVRQSLTWQTGTHPGTRGTAAYRAFLTFGAAMDSGDVARKLDADAAERYDVARAILAPNGSDVRESGSAGEVCASTGLTFGAMRDAVSAYYADGHPVPAEIATLPAPGTAAPWSGTGADGSDDFRGCEGAGPVDVVNPERTHGKCPACLTYIPLTDSEEENRIGSHFEYGVTAPANRKRLSSRSLDTVEHGSVPGSPMDANTRRIAETLCKGSRKVIADADGGTVTCPGTDCGRRVELKPRRKGDDVVWFVPDHTRPGESFRRSGDDGKGERSVTPRGSGADAGKGARDHGSVNGSATTGKHNLPPVQPKNGWAAVAGTWSLPAMVSPGIDPGAAGEWCPVCQDTVDVAHRGKSRTWRRKHSKAVAKYRAERKAERDARKAADIAAGLAIPASERRARRKAASIGSSAAGTMASTGRVIHAECVRG